MVQYLNHDRQRQEGRWSDGVRRLSEGVPQVPNGGQTQGSMKVSQWPDGTSVVYESKWVPQEWIVVDGCARLHESHTIAGGRDSENQTVFEGGVRLHEG